MFGWWERLLRPRTRPHLRPVLRMTIRSLISRIRFCTIEIIGQIFTPKLEMKFKRHSAFPQLGIHETIDGKPAIY
jgi:hypothetical protein